MNFTAIALFILATFLFSMFVAFLLRFVVFRYVGLFGLSAIPYFAWVVLLIVIIVTLQYAGVPLSQYYAAFFRWLATQLDNNPFTGVSL